MNRRILGLALVGILSVVLAGCAPKPTYAEVRQETLDAMDEVVDLLPDHGRISQTPEFEPYGCHDQLLLGQKQNGAFFTGQWVVAVAPDFDVSRFTEQLPRLLGDGWVREDLGVPVKRAYVYLVRTSPHMTLSVGETTLDGAPAIELLAISRCGVEPPED